MRDRDDAATGRDVTASAASWRRLSARVLLSLAALIQLGLIAALPLDAYRSAQRSALISLVAQLIATVACAIAMRRELRAVRLVLSLYSGYGLFVILRVAPWVHFIDILRGAGEPTWQFYSRVIVTLLITCVVSATVLTWMLPSGESSTRPPQELAS
ncbi:MAG: hypothetical protein ABI884_10225 [Gemmatimonadota bacterium]